MADAKPLEIWSVATFNVVIFGLVGVLTGHLSGRLTDILPALGTVPGVLVFGYLWVLVLIATRWALDEGGLDRLTQGELRNLLLRGALGGALVGMAFLVGIILVGGLIRLLTSGLELLSLGLISLFGAVISAIIGALVGVVFVLVDAAFYHAAAKLDPDSFGDGRYPER